jgi:hypothetical protein
MHFINNIQFFIVNENKTEIIFIIFLQFLFIIYLFFCKKIIYNIIMFNTYKLNMTY